VRHERLLHVPKLSALSRRKPSGKRKNVRRLKLNNAQRRQPLQRRQIGAKGNRNARSRRKKRNREKPEPQLRKEANRSRSVSLLQKLAPRRNRQRPVESPLGPRVIDVCSSELYTNTLY
jgi:hypothetical protein